MNRTNVQLLRDTLAKHYLAGEGIEYKGRRLGFSMAEWMGHCGDDADRINGCNTVACLGGWCNILNTDCDRPLNTEQAAEWLRLDWPRADTLFYPRGLQLYSVTVPEALLVLDHLLATGKVDWSIILTRREKLRTNGYVPASPVYGRPETVAP